MFRPTRATLLAASILLLPGCASLTPQSCEQFEASRKTTNYATTYRLESAQASPEMKPLRKNEVAAAQHYRMIIKNDSVRPCSHVKIQKELTLLRRGNVAMTFVETREFFAEDGTRIATKTETLTDQLVTNGRYVAEIPLPIPKNAPPGGYRLTSTLAIKSKGNGKPQTLARTYVTFRVVGSNN